MTDNHRGILTMIGSMALFTFNDACMKALSDELPFFQAVFMRGAATSVLLALIAWHMGAFRVRLSRRDWGLIALRTLAEIAAAYLFLTALFHAPIANVSAILQALPLTVTLAGALFLGESIGWRRLTAIMVGFVGVLLIIKPGTTALQPAAIGALGAAFLFAVAMTLMRRLGTTESAATITFYLSVFITLVSLVLIATLGWVAPTPGDFLVLALIGLVGGTAQLFLTQSLRLGEAAVVSPLRYTSIIWAVLFGYIFWDALPDALVVAGLAIVISSGLYILHRETRLAIIQRRRDITER